MPTRQTCYELSRSSSQDLEYLGSPDSGRALIFCVALPQRIKKADPLLLGVIQHTTKEWLDAQLPSQLQGLEFGST